MFYKMLHLSFGMHLHYITLIYSLYITLIYPNNIFPASNHVHIFLTALESSFMHKSFHA